MDSPRRFTVAEYHRLLAVGILQSGDPYELFEGLIVKTHKRGPPNAATVSLAGDGIRSVLPPPWRLREQCAITLADSEPEPAFAVIPGPAQRYTQGHPTAADIAMVGEVADITLHHDRTTKGRIYARAGVAAYWILNLVDRQVEVYTDPDAAADEPAFRQRTDYRLGDSVPLVLDGREVARLPVHDLLP